MKSRQDKNGNGEGKIEYLRIFFPGLGEVFYNPRTAREGKKGVLRKENCPLFEAILFYIAKRSLKCEIVAWWSRNSPGVT